MEVQREVPNQTPHLSKITRKSLWKAKRQSTTGEHHNYDDGHHLLSPYYVLDTGFYVI